MAAVSQNYGDVMGRIDHLPMIAIGGAGGALVRWGVAEAWGAHVFPWPTFLVNVIGCALLAAFTADGVPKHLRRLLAVGFCGGLTTFSTLSVDVVRLQDSGDTGVAALYLTASVVAGLAVFVLVRSLRPQNKTQATT